MSDQNEQETGGTGLGHRSVTMTRTEKGSYLVTNVRGGTLFVFSQSIDGALVGLVDDYKKQLERVRA